MLFLDGVKDRIVGDQNDLITSAKHRIVGPGRVVVDSKGTFSANDRIVGDQNELLPAMIYDRNRILCDTRAAKDRIAESLSLAASKLNLLLPRIELLVGPLATKRNFCRQFANGPMTEVGDLIKLATKGPRIELLAFTINTYILHFGRQRSNCCPVGDQRDFLPLTIEMLGDLYELLPPRIERIIELLAAGDQIAFFPPAH